MGFKCSDVSFFVRVWKHIIQKGDTVIDATCGNGYDTLALLTMVSDESYNGCVFGMDIQQEALDNTYSLLEISVEENKVLNILNHILCLFEPFVKIKTDLHLA